MHQSEKVQLFGGGLRWDSKDWTAQDDSIRGGNSTSYMLPSTNGTSIVFQGMVDDETLGGAGFASQRTTGERDWDLSGYDGIELTVKRGYFMDKILTLVLKDTIPDPSLETPAAARERENNEALRREKPKTTLSYEYNFRPSHPQPKDGEVIFMPFREFKAVYRGREVDGPHKTLDVGGIKRMSFMVRSFFRKQSGPFQITILGVAAVKMRQDGFKMKKTIATYDEMDHLDDEMDDEYEDEKAMMRGGRRNENCGVCVIS